MWLTVHKSDSQSAGIRISVVVECCHSYFLRRTPQKKRRNKGACYSPLLWLCTCTDVSGFRYPCSPFRIVRYEF
ncbi:hypothetical protein L6164_013789 [Bauhinia variegata]|uniref:Uncharacterized protein n=1 Tax=Bauhinia variegata TaxID=167791 RepID=A0ACB9NGJ3_BAUVA|nr:hypothetical protein L6164_013789 [Bauhinia variegata]